MPTIVNLRQDPFERLSRLNGKTVERQRARLLHGLLCPRVLAVRGLVQDKVKELALTAIDYPPMQDPASFNLEAVKKQIDEMIKAQHGQ